MNIWSVFDHFPWRFATKSAKSATLRSHPFLKKKNPGFRYQATPQVGDQQCLCKQGEGELSRTSIIFCSWTIVKKNNGKKNFKWLNSWNVCLLEWNCSSFNKCRIVLFSDFLLELLFAGTFRAGTASKQIARQFFSWKGGSQARQIWGFRGKKVSRLARKTV